MSNPETLADLVRGGHATIGEVRDIAKHIFNGDTSGAGPEGYVVTFPDFETLPDHIQSFVIKAFQFSTVENVIDFKERMERLHDTAQDAIEEVVEVVDLDRSDLVPEPEEVDEAPEES